MPLSKKNNTKFPKEGSNVSDNLKAGKEKAKKHQISNKRKDEKRFSFRKKVRDVMKEKEPSEELSTSSKVFHNYRILFTTRSRLSS